MQRVCRLRPHQDQRPGTMPLTCAFMVHPTRPGPRQRSRAARRPVGRPCWCRWCRRAVVHVVGERGVRRPVAGRVAVGERDQGLGHVSVRARTQAVGGDLEPVDQGHVCALGARLAISLTARPVRKRAPCGPVLPPLQVAGSGQGSEERLGQQVGGLSVGRILAVLGGLAQLAKISEPGPDAGDDLQVGPIADEAPPALSLSPGNVAACFGYFMETGRPEGSKFSPDSLLAFCSQIVSWYAKGERPDASLVHEMIKDYGFAVVVLGWAIRPSFTHHCSKRVCVQSRLSGVRAALGDPPLHATHGRACALPESKHVPILIYCSARDRQQAAAAALQRERGARSVARLQGAVRLCCPSAHIHKCTGLRRRAGSCHSLS
ncbi:hypothetical protein SAMN05428941_0044 [Streptomyces sp. 2114.2]|nr:hypothetical protein BX268_0040 [Streptomyces sp. 2221.1]SDS20467.1 hypothetical protein SAMN05428941_0044 [Streptomyces sp. 2114.2]